MAAAAAVDAGDRAFCLRLDAFTRWCRQHGVLQPKCHSSDPEEARLAGWQRSLRRQVAAAGGRSAYAAKRPYRAALLDVILWWEWHPDPDAAFRARWEAREAWRARHGGRAPSTRAAADPEERRHARWAGSLLQAVKAAGGGGAYARKHPERADLLDAAGLWGEAIGAARRAASRRAPFAVRFQACERWRLAHPGQEPRITAAADPEEVRLARWRGNLRSAVRKAGGRAGYQSRWPQRAALLEGATWWEWPAGARRGHGGQTAAAGPHAPGCPCGGAAAACARTATLAV